MDFPSIEFLNDQRGDWTCEIADAYLDAGKWRLVYGVNAAANMDGGDCSYQPVLPFGA